jgi:uncharacterized protein YggT (Ycf19 family)
VDYLRISVGLLLNVLHVAILTRIVLSWFRIRPANLIVRSLYEMTERCWRQSVA